MGKQEDYDFEFAIPGLEEDEKQDNFALKPEDHEDKKKNISLFWLLQHYSKENAAIYKAQQSIKKQQKRRKKEEIAGGDTKESLNENVLKSSSLKKDVKVHKGEVKEEEQEEDFGATVYVKRDSRQCLIDELPYRKAVLECPSYGQTVLIDKIPFVIGRSASGVDLCIADNKTVGRKHAVISYYNGSYFIKDLKSLNHVFLNGSQIPTEKETKLNHRMKITLGDEGLIFCLLDVNG